MMMIERRCALCMGCTSSILTCMHGGVQRLLGDGGSFGVEVSATVHADALVARVNSCRVTLQPCKRYRERCSSDAPG